MRTKTWKKSYKNNFSVEKRNEGRKDPMIWILESGHDTPKVNDSKEEKKEEQEAEEWSLEKDRGRWQRREENRESD